MHDTLMTMQLHTVLFYGPAGSGKGTQAALLRDHLAALDPERKALHVVTGDMFRHVSEQDTYTGRLIREILEGGALQPAFLPIWLWASYFAENLTGEEHLLIDGFPRRFEEASVFDSAIQFYKRLNPVVFILNVDEAELMRRALEVRKRADDSVELMQRRIQWYHEEVVPTIEFFRQNASYRIEEVDGNRSIEDIQGDIRTRLGLV